MCRASRAQSARTRESGVSAGSRSTRAVTTDWTRHVLQTRACEGELQNTAGRGMYKMYACSSLLLQLYWSNAVSTVARFSFYAKRDESEKGRKMARMKTLLRGYFWRSRS